VGRKNGIDNIATWLRMSNDNLLSPAKLTGDFGKMGIEAEGGLEGKLH
jgi:hypothetical protein